MVVYTKQTREDRITDIENAFPLPKEELGSSVLGPTYEWRQEAGPAIINRNRYMDYIDAPNFTMHDSPMRTQPRKHIISPDPVGFAIADKLHAIAKESGMEIRDTHIPHSRKDILLPLDDAFKLAFAYLREQGQAEATLAPVERIVQEALAAAKNQTPSR